MTERAAFVVDLNTCTGCQACEAACIIANDLPADRSWRTVRTFNELHVPGVELLHLSLACNHCLDAPCMAQCPAGAYYRDPDTDALLIDAGACIGCRYCAWVCPYDAPRFDTERGVMTKCTGCVDRRHEGLEPACTSACPTGALTWRILPEARLTQDAPGFAQAGTSPGIRVIPLRDTRRVPEATQPSAMPPWRILYDKLTPRLRLDHEWPLAVFTWLLSLLVGIFAASRFGAPAPGWRLFLVLGLGGVLLGASHLGRWKRSPRAILHGGSSWLSREIAAFSGFLATATFVLTMARPSHWLIGTAVACGVASLVAVDRVYRVAEVRGYRGFHSAAVLPTGLLFACGWIGAAIPVLLIAGVKIVAYRRRKHVRARINLNTHPVLSAVRLIFLGGGSLVVFTLDHNLGFILIACAELIDRCEFYHEVDVPTPASLMLDDLARRLATSSGD